MSPRSLHAPELGDGVCALSDACPPATHVLAGANGVAYALCATHAARVELIATRAADQAAGLPSRIPAPATARSTSRHRTTRASEVIA